MFDGENCLPVLEITTCGDGIVLFKVISLPTSGTLCKNKKKHD